MDSEHWEMEYICGQESKVQCHSPFTRLYHWKHLYTYLFMIITYHRFIMRTPPQTVDPYAKCHISRHMSLLIGKQQIKICDIKGLYHWTIYLFGCIP